jgi:hypothetical protein
MVANMRSSTRDVPKLFLRFIKAVIFTDDGLTFNARISNWRQRDSKPIQKIKP